MCRAVDRDDRLKYRRVPNTAGAWAPLASREARWAAARARANSERVLSTVAQSAHASALARSLGAITRADDGPRALADQEREFEPGRVDARVT